MNLVLIVAGHTLLKILSTYLYKCKIIYNQDYF